MTAFEEQAAPLRVAHRYGNDLASLIAAEAAAVDLIEADLWLHRNRLEVRHRKTMGPVPLLWDRWSLHPGWTRRLGLADILAAVRPGSELLLDLKGREADLPERAIQAMERARPGARYSVSSQNWELLAPFRELPQVRVVYSTRLAAGLRPRDRPRPLRGPTGRRLAESASSPSSASPRSGSTSRPS